MEGVSVGSESCFRSARLELQVGMLIVVAYFATQQVTGVVVEPEAAVNPFDRPASALPRAFLNVWTCRNFRRHRLRFPISGKSGGGRSKNYKKRNEA